MARVTTIQISEALREKLETQKMSNKETYEEVILDLLEDTTELSEETKKAIRQAEADIKAGRVYTLTEVKKSLNINV